MDKIMKTLYFDANVWNHLVAPETPPALLMRIRERADAGELGLVGAFPVLEEVLAASRRKRRKSVAMRKLAFELVGHRWIREIIERIGLEITSRGPLDESLLYLPREDRRKIKGFTASDLEALEIADQMHALTTKFEADEEAARSLMAEKFGASPGSAEAREAMHGWFEEVDMDEWCRGALSPEHLEALEQAGLETTPQSVPSMWLFVRFKMARIRLCVGENQRISGSDLNDARHYAAGAYFDVLVTEDRRFRETCALIPEAPFEVWNISALATSVGVTV